MTTREACIQALKDMKRNYVLPEEGQKFPMYCAWAISDARFEEIIGLARGMCAATILEVAITLATCGYEPYMGLSNFLLPYVGDTTKIEELETEVTKSHAEIEELETKLADSQAELAILRSTGLPQEIKDEWNKLYDFIGSLHVGSTELYGIEVSPILQNITLKLTIMLRSDWNKALKMVDDFGKKL